MKLPFPGQEPRSIAVYYGLYVFKKVYLGKLNWVFVFYNDYDFRFWWSGVVKGKTLTKTQLKALTKLLTTSGPTGEEITTLIRPIRQLKITNVQDYPYNN